MPNASHSLVVLGELLLLISLVWIPAEEEQEKLRLVSPFQAHERVRLFQVLAYGVQAIFQLRVAEV